MTTAEYCLNQLRSVDFPFLYQIRDFPLRCNEMSTMSNPITIQYTSNQIEVFNIIIKKIIQAIEAMPPKMNKLYCFGCLIILKNTAVMLMAPTINKISPGMVKSLKGVSFKTEGLRCNKLPLGMLIINNPDSKDSKAINVANVYNKVFMMQLI